MKKVMIVAASVLAPLLLLVGLNQSAVAGRRQDPGAPAVPVTSAAVTANCVGGTQDSGAQYLICTPSGWETSSDLLVYAHGYMAPYREVEIPKDQMVLDNISITATVTSLGYAFATTSYYTNGLAVRPAISDLLDLVNIFTSTYGTPRYTYLAGVSEGGLIATLSVEQHPDVYDGGLAMCGPYGDFHYQINHFGDFRVVFDYFFPDLMPGSPITMPESFLSEWQSGFFSTTIKPEVEATEHANKVNQLLQVTGVSPYGYDAPTSTAAISEVLRYNVNATEDAKRKLGGQPFDNADRQYEGSDDDTALNDPENGVDRFSADPEALSAIETYYQTTGELSVPLVTLHTTGDPVVPYWHATRYLSKTMEAGNSDLHAHVPVTGHGHCRFDVTSVLQAFAQLVDMVHHQHDLFLPLMMKRG